MKAFDSEFGLDYLTAAVKCSEIGADLAQPFNQIESKTLFQTLANFSAISSSASFWIGTFIR